jgi:hypothetical protein
MSTARLLGFFTAILLAALVPASAATWSVPGDFATIQDAIDDSRVMDGDQIRVGRGNHAGALVNKAVEIKGRGRATIDSGPLHPAGLDYGFRLLAGSDGATISHLTFAVDLAIMNGEAVNGVTVTQCTFLDAIQAVSNWRGSGWDITQNEIVDLRTRNGGGIGILIADYTGGIVEDNVVAHNKISGTLHVWNADGGGYAGSGIVIFADYRWGRAGAEAVRDNRVVKNKIDIASDNPGVVDIVAFELTDTRDDPLADPFPVLYDNAIGFNNFRGTVNQIALTPPELEDYNSISRNLGDNRGHGLHPSVFR